MSNFYEDRCGRVAFERVLEVNEEMNFMDKSGHMLSCGGVYISRAATIPSTQNNYEFLNLPAPNKSVLTLKNNQIYHHPQDENQVKSEEMLEQVEVEGLKKMLREHMN